MRGIRFLLAVAVLFAIALPTGIAVSKTFSANETYVFGSRMITIEPFNENGTGYREGEFLRVWRKGECQEDGVIQVCLTSSSATQVVFEETSLAADVTGTHSVTPTSARAGSEVEGVFAITNKGRRIARDATLTVTTQAPASFRGGGTTETYTSTVSIGSTWRPEYRLTRPDNGTAVVSAVLTYHDGNTTRTVALPNATVTFTTPFTDKIGYDPLATVLERLISVNLTRVATNVTVRTTITLPPEAVITGYSRALGSTSRVNELVDTELLNTTLTSYNVTYRFTDRPTQPLTVTYRYEEGGEPVRTFTRTLPFTSPEEGPEPRILFNATMLRAREEGTFLVGILNPRGGSLLVESALVNETLAADGGPYRLVAIPEETGLYSVFITYTWVDSFGRERTTRGSGIVDVYDDGVGGSGTMNGSSNATGTPPLAGGNAGESENGSSAGRDEEVDGSGDGTTVTLRDPPPVSNVVALWIAGGCAIGTLAALYAVLRRFRDPLRRVERLVRRAVELRTALAHKQGPVTDDEIARLAAIEEQLDALKRTLE